MLNSQFILNKKLKRQLLSGKKLIFLLLAFTTSINFTNAQWKSMHSPSHFPITSIAASGTNIFAGTGGGGVFLTPDSGINWVAVNNGLTDTMVTSLLVINGTSDTDIFAGTDSGIFLSTNNGATWTTSSNGLSGSNNGLWGPITSLANLGPNIFAGIGGPGIGGGGVSGGGILLSTDMGGSWTVVNNGLTANNGPPDPRITSLVISGTNILAGAFGGAVNLSTDIGSTWTELDNGSIPGPITSFAKYGANIFVGSNRGGVYLSVNTGLGWTLVDSGLLETNVNSVLLAVNGTNMFASTYGGGIFLSTQTIGSNWTVVNSGLTDTNITSLAVLGTNIYVGTDTSGVWKRQLSDLLKCAPIINASSSTILPCGGSVTLYDSLGSGYLWSDGETTQSIVVTTAGNYSCNVTTGCGNIISNVVSVTILVPGVTISSGGATTICQGDSVTLTADTVGNGSSYLWSDGETTRSIVVTTASDYSCHVTLCDIVVNSNVITVIVNQIPDAAITPNGDSLVLCAGAATLTATSANSFFFMVQWSNGATTQSITVSTTGIDSVIISNSYSGCSATAKTDVAGIYPLPSTPVITPGGATTVCDGDSVLLTSSAATGYNWSTGATTQSITVKSTGSYSVTVTNANGCSATSQDTQVTIHSNPIPPTIHQFNDTLKSNYATDNQWYLNGNIISGATGQYYVVTQSGIYTVKLTNGNGCSSSMSAPFTIVGIPELTNDYSFSIYPNPAGNQITVVIANPDLIGMKQSLALDIYNILGEKAPFAYVQGDASSQAERSRSLIIDVSTLPAGMYFLQMKTERAIDTERFVKE